LKTFDASPKHTNDVYVQVRPGPLRQVVYLDSAIKDEGGPDLFRIVKTSGLAGHPFGSRPCGQQETGKDGDGHEQSDKHKSPLLPQAAASASLHGDGFEPIRYMLSNITNAKQWPLIRGTVGGSTACEAVARCLHRL
jgi:hypothetical protein